MDESTLLVGRHGFDPDEGNYSRIESIELTTGNRELVLTDARMGDLTPDRKAVVYTDIDG